jgi:hypothetical protein
MQLSGYNVIEYLRFGNFSTLKELYADFHGSSVESIAEMKKLAPNLEEIGITADSSDVINALVEQYGSQGNLRSLVISDGEWKLSVDQQFVCPLVKKIVCCTPFDSENVCQLVKMFPNLEELSMYEWSGTLMIHDLLLVLLTQLKQLKKLMLTNYHLRENLNSSLILGCIGDSGENLEDMQLMRFHDSDPSTRTAHGFEIWEKNGELCLKRAN